MDLLTYLEAHHQRIRDQVPQRVDLWGRSVYEALAAASAELERDIHMVKQREIRAAVQLTSLTERI